MVDSSSEGFIPERNAKLRSVGKSYPYEPEVALQEAVECCRMLSLVFDGICERFLLLVVR